MLSGTLYLECPNAQALCRFSSFRYRRGRCRERYCTKADHPRRHFCLFVFLCHWLTLKRQLCVISSFVLSSNSSGAGRNQRYRLGCFKYLDWKFDRSERFPDGCQQEFGFHCPQLSRLFVALFDHHLSLSAVGCQVGSGEFEPEMVSVLCFWQFEHGSGSHQPTGRMMIGKSSQFVSHLGAICHWHYLDELACSRIGVTLFLDLGSVRSS